MLNFTSWLELVDEVERRAPLASSYQHGAHHWRLVAWTGAELLEQVGDADRLIVLLFALFHDSQRENEYEDPAHGKRGGSLARELLEDRPQILETARLDVLIDACTRHTGAGPTDDPTLGVCWDSDRLNLWRVGTEPKGPYLSTPHAREPTRIQWARKLQDEDFSWEQIASRYDLNSPKT